MFPIHLSDINKFGFFLTIFEKYEGRGGDKEVEYSGGRKGK